MQFSSLSRPKSEMPLIDDETGSVAEEEGECLGRRVDRFHPGAGDGALPLNEGRAKMGHCTGGPLLTSHVDNSQKLYFKALQFPSNRLSHALHSHQRSNFPITRSPYH